MRNQCEDIDEMLDEASIIKESRTLARFILFELFPCIEKPSTIYRHILKHYITVDI